ncbi:molybdopterin-dependent oxidoreductase [Vibrio sp. Isolate25]|uniref:molybdopterin-dependent oxidoreductase n=1 Tax=unclassified Vibrio TaxID=2614977 RepID=UPI001EFD560B|nr:MULTISPECIES: molybdopterin-dependent oxidoreductase [unclassified Vibrio]MCG9596202.1 molybdopterin-dependent oxidoreductase [Vibrio sp. Isolate25]MCG9676766.1 molybdopterin-dependent oxidoreductase [Vibrio sp. Isolate24]
MRGVVLAFLLLVSLPTLGADLVVRFENSQPKTLAYEQLISQYPPTSFKTKLPWYPDANQFTGFRVSDMLANLVKEETMAVSFIALNDYAASTTIENIIKYDPIIAYKMNGKKMKVRNKGPYWLVFNLDKYPEIDNAAFHSQMVWQIDEIMIHQKTNENTD